MTHYSATATGKASQPANLSTPLLALLREHTDQPWEVDPSDPTMAILRVPLLDLVREHLAESEPVKPTKPVTTTAKKAPAKAPTKPQVKPVWPAKSEGMIRREIKLRARRADGIASSAIVDLVPGSSEVRTAFLNGMIDDGILRKEGKSKGTRYFAVSKSDTKQVKPPTKPTTKPVKKPPPKVTAPVTVPKVEKRPDMSTDDRVAAMKAIFSDGLPHAAAEFYHLWPSDEDAKSGSAEGLGYYLRYRLFVNRTGKGSAMRYILDSAKPTAVAKEPDPDLFDLFDPPKKDEGASE